MLECRGQGRGLAEKMMWLSVMRHRVRGWGRVGGRVTCRRGSRRCGSDGQTCERDQKLRGNNGLIRTKERWM